jgi:5-methylcytosine-specific restriction endonuclease McrA
MTRRELIALANPALLDHARERLLHENATIADVVNALAEIDTRKLYIELAYPSLRAFCTGYLGMSEDAAAKRIQVVRVAQEFEAIVPMLADGRLSLNAVVLLSPHLRPENAGQLLAAAAGLRRSELEQLIAERFPRADLVSLVAPVSCPPRSGVQEPACETREQHAARHVMSSPRPAVAPLSAQRFGVQFTIDEATHELLRYAQDLLGNAVPSGDVGEVFVRALAAYAAQLEKQRFGTGSRSHARRGSANARYIPTAVRSAVWKRDGGRCAFTSDGGHRCEATRALEFDHVTPVARGGGSTESNLRLLCRAHNQHAANRALGERFMEGRREGARERRDRVRHLASANGAAEAPGARPAPPVLPAPPVPLDVPGASPDANAPSPVATLPPAPAAHPDVALCLKSLGYRAPEIRDAMLRCRAVAGAPVEAQVRFALRVLAPAAGVRRSAGSVGKSPQ